MASPKPQCLSLPAAETLFIDHCAHVLLRGFWSTFVPSGRCHLSPSTTYFVSAVHHHPRFVGLSALLRHLARKQAPSRIDVRTPGVQVAYHAEQPQSLEKGATWSAGERVQDLEACHSLQVSPYPDPFVVKVGPDWAEAGCTGSGSGSSLVNRLMA